LKNKVQHGERDRERAKYPADYALRQKREGQRGYDEFCDAEFTRFAFAESVEFFCDYQRGGKE
jgi:hypothetical protein